MTTKIVYYSTPFLLVLGGLAAVSVQKENIKVDSSTAKADLKFLAQHLSLASASLAQSNIESEKSNKIEKKEEVLSDSIQFCGERVPIEVSKVAKKLDHEMDKYLVNGGNAMLGLSRLSGRYKKEIVQTLKANGLPADLYYLAVAESGLSNATSPRGAKGFWQFMPETAKIYGLEVSETVDERLHPQKATQAACKYLKLAHKRFGNWALAAAAYNMGEGGVENAIHNQKIKDYYKLDLRSETEQYVFRILALKYILEKPKEHGVRMNDKYKYKPIAYRSVRVNTSIPDLAAFAAKNHSSLYALKMMNPWLIANRLEVKAGKVFEIRFPLDEMADAKEMLTVPFDANSLKNKK